MGNADIMPRRDGSPDSWIIPRNPPGTISECATPGGTGLTRRVTLFQSTSAPSPAARPEGSSFCANCLMPFIRSCRFCCCAGGRALNGTL